MSKVSLKQILGQSTQEYHAPSLGDMGISISILEEVYQWANSMTTYGEVASYIPELKKANPEHSSIAIGDLQGNLLEVGNCSSLRFSIQSVIKPFLYIFALETGTDAGTISDIEATAMHFNVDHVLLPNSYNTRPGHPLNNAGAISSAGAIDHFDDFLAFMQRLTQNPNLGILDDIYQSEMQTNFNNRAIAYRLAATGRFKNEDQAVRALDNYTKACAIGITVKEATIAGLALASGGKWDGKQMLKSDHVVRVINAMNTFGLYEHTGEISLLAAGARALSCKSGVGGLILNIDPTRGAFCTFGPRLDHSGNSVFGKYALVPLNHLMSAPNAIKLSESEICRVLELDKNSYNQP
jgi:glutaminase